MSMNANTAAVRHGRKRLNIVDYILITFFVAAFVIGLYLFFGEKKAFKNERTEILYEITVDSIDSDFIPKMKKGDILYDPNTAFEIGIVKSVIAENIFVFSDEAPGIPSVEPYKRKMIFTVQANAEKFNSTYSVNGCTVAEGGRVRFRTPELEYAGRCTNIIVMNENG